MKALFALFLITVLPPAAQAHELKTINAVTNAQAQAVLAASEALHAEDKKFTAVESFKIVKIAPARKEGESLEDLYGRILENSLHAEYPITGDEEGYSIGQVSGTGARREIEHDVRDFYIQDKALEEAFISAVDAAAQNPNLIVLMGSGSGNNTSAYIIAVADPANNELVYFISSNFGSDS